MSRSAAESVYGRRLTIGVAKPVRWMSSRDVRYSYAVPHGMLRVQYQPFRGSYPIRLVLALPGREERVTEFPVLWSRALKKVSLGMEPGAVLPPLPSTSTLFKKLPRLMEFLTVTAYEDGSPRAPGRIWIDQDGTAFTVTLFEPSAMVKMRCRAATLDDAFTLAETHLGADNPAWEIDIWARERVEKKKKK